MTGVTVRPAAPGDAEALPALHVAAWEAAYRGVIPDAAMARNDLENCRLMWRGLLVEAERPPMVDVALLASGSAGEGSLAGFVWSRLVEQGEAAFDSEVVALNIHPDHWRRGIGRRLMATAAGRLSALGAQSVYLWVFRENLPARAFYDSLEGRIVEQDEHRYGDVLVPTIAYAWKPLSRLLAAARP